MFPRTMTASAALPPPPAQDDEARFTQAWAAQPRVDLGIAAGTAKVVVVKFNDWLCPSCKAYAMAYQPVFDKYEQEKPGAVKYVVKDWPWDANCNYTRTATIPGHEASCDAAVAVRIARDRSKEKIMVDWLFANQERLVEQDIAGGAAQSQQAIREKVAELVGVKTFDLEKPAKLTDIKRDVADGEALKIDTTPTYFINGVRIPNGQALPPQYFELALKIELARSGGKQ
jgi:protein-disulfide isomerase